jgi:hypothetical protein
MADTRRQNLFRPIPDQALVFVLEHEGLRMMPIATWRSRVSWCSAPATISPTATARRRRCRLSRPS